MKIDPVRRGKADFMSTVAEATMMSQATHAGNASMANLSSFVLVVALAALSVACSASGNGAPASADSASAVGGTVAPVVRIHSITFLVDDAELILSEKDVLPASPGTEVWVVEVTISVGEYVADGGEACVDFAPVLDSGEEVAAEHTGTHMVPLVPGLITVPGPDRSWTIEGQWVGIAVVVNHWPEAMTEDNKCAEGKCERDQRFVLQFRS